MLLIGGNYAPELTGIGKYNGEMINYIASQGYECSVITTFPYYPHWRVQEPYTKSSWFFRKEVVIAPGAEGNAINVYRCPHFIPKNPSGLKRVISDFSFFFSAVIKIFQFLFKKSFDVVIVVAPPFQLGLLGLFYTKIKRRQVHLPHTRSAD